MWLFLALLLAAAEAHVRLTFPPARSPATDYLSNKRNAPPCGVPKPPPGQGVRTFLQSGSVVDLEWFTAVPHKGSIRLEVLNDRDVPIAVFTSFDDPYNVSQSSKKVELPPEFECHNCAIRLTHQATEYGGDYEFFSCADIEIHKVLSDGDSCLNGGKRNQGKCQCQATYTGSHCQHHEECVTDDDCGPQGICGNGAADERSHCFCPNGRYGDKCETDSQIFHSLEDFDDSLYNMREAQDNKIFWRIIHDEIEMVLRYPGTSWAAIGWKPKDAKCESPVPLSSFIPSVSTTARTAVNNETFGGKGDDCGPNEEYSECPESGRSCEASCDWTKFPETTPNCPRQCGTARCVCKAGYVRMTNDEDACVPFTFCEKEVDEQCPQNSTWAKCGLACEPSCANMYDPSPCTTSCDKAACTCADNYVRFNGQCIYWGDCPDVDKHSTQHEEKETVTVPGPSVSVVVTPKPTTVARTSAPKITTCAVNETVNECGRVCEADCNSIFTRAECNECAEPACACLQGFSRTLEGQCVYWGDCPPATGTTPAPSTVAPKTTSKKSMKPRVDGDVCYGEFRSPAGCTDCDYKLSWNYLDDSDDIEFSLETKMAGNGWTGVGLNTDGTMVGADMLILKSMNGKLSLHDMSSDGYGAPKEDDQQDLTSREVIGTHENGVLRAQFIRRRNTGDATDKQFDSECWKMMFPINGGKLDASGNITIHDVTPLISDRQVCIRSCHEQKTTTDTAANCQAEYRYPENCRDEECEYTATWKYDNAKKDVLFEISSRSMGRWTGIGFSKDGQMANSDVYTGWVYDGKAYVTDRFAYGRQLPAIDPADRQDIYDINGTMADDVQTIRFRRKVTTKDKTTDLPLDQCYYFLFPIGGGRVIAKKASDFSNPKTPIGYHDLYQPRVSPQKICICDENGVALAKTEPSRVRARREALVEQQHPMDCADVVVGSVLDGRGRVKDFWSTSKATPRPDSYFGGVDSLTSAVAFNSDGITTVAFRRKLRSSDKWDHSIRPGPMTVIWAKGVDPENYQHTVGEPGRAPSKFFSPNVLKYHGKNQRGALTIDFFDEKKTESTLHGLHTDQPTCTGRYSVPEDCTTDCRYEVEWTSDGTVARFTVRTDLKDGQWTALGFSKDGLMAESDVIVMGVNEGTVTVTDQYMSGYSKPVVDEMQDIFDVETAFKNGRLVANFSRELNSKDAKDLNLQKCAFLLYTPEPGVFEKTGELRKHTETPLVSQRKVCLNTCSEASDREQEEEAVTTTEATTTEEETTAPTTTATATKKVTEKVPEKKTRPSVELPPLVKAKKPMQVYEPTDPIKARYGLRVRILNREYVPDLADPQTEYYNSFTKEVVPAIDQLLEKRWKGMRVSKIMSYEKGSVIAELEVVSTGAVPRPIEVKSLIEENAIRGQVGTLAIEPSTVKSYEIAAEPVHEANAFRDARQYLIIGAVSLFLLLCILVAICLACKCKSKKRYNYPVPHPAGGYYGTIGPKKPAGFENVGYNGRQYSQATTASTKPGGQTPPADESVPEGMGETTYKEWNSRVGSKPASQQVEESAASARPPAQPYVSYPNDPSAYTLRGEHRMAPREKYFRY